MAMFVRVRGNHCYPCDPGHAVRMRLERWIPEILWIMLLAGEEASVGRFGINGKRQRKCDFHCRSIRPLGLPLEVEHLEIADARDTERFSIISSALTSRTSIDSPSSRARKSRVNAPNENELGECG